MIKYQIKFKSSSAKEFKNLPSNIQKPMGTFLEKIRENPRMSGVIKLQGDDKLYRIRLGDYHLVFQIDDSQKLIKITRVRHRQDVYKK